VSDQTITLLVQGTWGALEEQLDDPEVLVVDRPELVLSVSPEGNRRRRARRAASATYYLPPD
jgi:hypothetical protein